MKPLGELRCPSCLGPLRPVAVVCDQCGLRIEGNFAQNEFAALDADALHLLRIFVRYEGRIRDMESALGLSYPTIKLRLAELRRKLALAPDEPSAPTGGEEPASAEQPEPLATGTAPVPAPSPAPQALAVQEVLAALEAGRIPFDEALRRIRGESGGGSSDNSNSGVQT